MTRRTQLAIEIADEVVAHSRRHNRRDGAILVRYMDATVHEMLNPPPADLTQMRKRIEALAVKMDRLPGGVRNRAVQRKVFEAVLKLFEGVE